MTKNQRGDTLVEVLIAITVLGIIIVGVMATMNRSLVSILNSAERTATRADINSQTDLLNYVHRNDSETWEKIKNLAYKNEEDGKVPPEVMRDPVCQINVDGHPGDDETDPNPGSFYLAPIVIDKEDGGDGISVFDVELAFGLTNEVNGTNQFQRAIPGRGVWIDAVYYPQNDTTNRRSYIDFYIKACWVPFGGRDVDNQSITVARIYDYTLDDIMYEWSYGGANPNPLTACFGDSQQVTIPRDGRYSLQAWGAQGGFGNPAPGGRGGYSYGEIRLNKGDVLHVGMGCHGGTTADQGPSTVGGWNGGGIGHSSSHGSGGGGGASHVAWMTGQLYELSSNRDKVLIVAGGGGGSYDSSIGGYGGDYSGQNGTIAVGATGNPKPGGGGTTTAGGGSNAGWSESKGAFGKGGSESNNAAAGGGGWYGGGAGDNGGTGGGGSCWLSSALSNAYTCGGFPGGSAPCERFSGREGNGYVKITYLGP
ncbi:prepilin-type N-terminal cleavage/methylation domain-containing protein [Candidatus Saccharibacteria bacterium]|nr:prepilin-type N-terminal cleavage/methylation domain-containing protein [Candidatus Saccharibacteria bacterium]